MYIFFEDVTKKTYYNNIFYIIRKKHRRQRPVYYRAAAVRIKSRLYNLKQHYLTTSFFVTVPLPRFTFTR